MEGKQIHQKEVNSEKLSYHMLFKNKNADTIVSLLYKTLLAIGEKCSISVILENYPKI